MYYNISIFCITSQKCSIDNKLWCNYRYIYTCLVLFQLGFVNKKQQLYYKYVFKTTVYQPPPQKKNTIGLSASLALKLVNYCEYELRI